MQDQRPLVVTEPFNRKAGPDPGLFPVEVNLQFNTGNPVVGRRVVPQVNALRALLFRRHQMMLISRITKATTASSGSRTAGQSLGESLDSFINVLTPGKNHRMASSASTPSSIFSQVESGSIEDFGMAEFEA